MVTVSVYDLRSIQYAIDDVMEDEDNSIPGCDCGCGGDSIDYEARDEARTDAIGRLEALGITIDFSRKD